MAADLHKPAVGRLFLFDIDGTLLLSGGAGVRAMTRTFEQVFGVIDAFASSDIAGRTDTFILSNAMQAVGVPDTRENHRRFRNTYVEILAEEIEAPSSRARRLMPGIMPLLQALRGHDGSELALLTGNFEAAAYLKLGALGIAEFFPWGAFGEESAERAELARLAMRRAEERAIPPHIRDRAVVIGDTPHDVDCARAVGARVLAVATGSYSVEQLTAAAADVVLPDLSDTERVIELLLGMPA
jgi:phosphoglycolate phosphatase-like HAD superfamily hydrolase